MDPNHLAEIADKSGAKYCLVSHMRGKVGDMDKITEICEKRGIVMVEDCAHSLGVSWKGKHTGHHGAMACISSQSYKMLNSGEGGFLLTNDDELAVIWVANNSDISFIVQDYHQSFVGIGLILNCEIRQR
jgi:dTDP-4-amino-4,6-dideoxygalactose transaminase